ncbi:MAG: hypothetical protein ACRCYD_07100, partial [Plesiomonas sp.]
VYLPVFGKCECVVDCGKVISVYQIEHGKQLVTDSDNGKAAQAICELAERAIAHPVAQVTEAIMQACRAGVIDEFVLERLANSWVHEQECATAACGGQNGN